MQGWESVRWLVIGITLLKNREIGKITFRFFDRYEIHIQAPGHSSSSTFHDFKILSFDKKQNDTKVNRNKMTLGTQDFRFCFEIFRFSDMKINMFKDVSTLACICWSNLVVINRSTGPDFDIFLEVPEIIQKVLQYDRGP